MTPDPNFQPKSQSSERPCNRIPASLFWEMAAAHWGRVPPHKNIEGEVELTDSFLTRLCETFFGEMKPQPVAPTPKRDQEPADEVPPYINVETLLESGYEPITDAARLAYPRKTPKIIVGGEKQETQEVAVGG